MNVSHPESHTGRVPALDGLRALAIGLVVGLHAGVPGMRGGSLGVTVFFVLSGFLITGILLRPGALGARGIGRFYVRRWLRLFPALAVVVGFAVGYALLALDGEDRRFLLQQSLTSITYTTNLLMGRGATTEDYGLLGHTWSLGVEEQFYLVWPLLLLVLLRCTRSASVRAGVVLVLATGFLGWRMYLSSQGLAAHVGMNIDAQADSLLVGSALALVWPAVRERAGRRPRLVAGLAVGSLVLLLAETAVPGLHHVLPLDANYTLVALASAALIVWLLVPGPGPVSTRLHRAFTWRPVVWIGLVSYSLYLWHRVVFEIVREQAGVDTFAEQLLWGPAALAVSLAAAALSFHLVERPFLGLRSRFGGDGDPAPGTPPLSRRPVRVAVVGAVLLAVVGAGGAVVLRLGNDSGAAASDPVGCAPGPQRSGPVVDLGVQTAGDGRAVPSLGPRELDRLLDRAEEAGAGIISTAAAWRTIQPTRGGGYDFERVDEIVDAAAERDLKVRLQVVSMPLWAAEGGGLDDYWRPPLSVGELAAWEVFVEDLARHVRGRVDYLEIWNEPNEYAFWPTGPDPAAYARLLGAAHGAVKAVAPGLQVVTGGLSNNDIGFLENLYADISVELGPDARPFDMVGVHPFAGDRAPDVRLAEWSYTREPFGEFDQNFLGYIRLHEVMAENGDADVPLYIGEFGYNTEPWREFGPVPDRTRADYLTRALEAMTCHRYVGVVSWYYFHPTPWNEDSWTLVDEDAVPNLTFDALRTWTRRAERAAR
ncbi:acyltransferase family protein [Nocardioides donggukensis]|uniref:Acyltransferase family protein n=1 Tax=Nocardioides donggukensis TaxID=2774019 RepID=A0A927Q264_9ACTN|nr:acyltransferase family protein [Nocardioides donggukensis]MBD8869386.1 acyltransferase family protein [Nocardioides donggukensis]